MNLTGIRDEHRLEAGKVILIVCVPEPDVVAAHEVGVVGEDVLARPGGVQVLEDEGDGAQWGVL